MKLNSNAFFSPQSQFYPLVSSFTELFHYRLMAMLKQLCCEQGLLPPWGPEPDLGKVSLPSLQRPEVDEAIYGTGLLRCRTAGVKELKGCSTSGAVAAALRRSRDRLVVFDDTVDTEVNFFALFTAAKCIPMVQEKLLEFFPTAAPLNA